MTNKYPFYLKSTVILFGLILLVYAMFNLRDIMVPLSFALLISILLNPVYKRFQRIGIPKVLSILLTLFAAFLLVAGIMYFLSAELSSFSDQLPLLKQRFNSLLEDGQKFLDKRLGVSMHKQQQYIQDAEADIKPLLGATMGSLMGTLAVTILLPVYCFLFLYYKKLLLEFLYEVFAEENAKQVDEVLKQTQGAIQQYMMGLLIEALIVATLNSLALWILGVDYAILLGVMGALLNVLPYIGGIIAVALPVIMATMTKDGFQTQLWIIVAYMIIQFIDNHFLIPYIVSSKVKINALVSIICVLLGGLLWGIAGMFLSIPLIGVLKIIFDRLPDLKPWGKLLGTEVPTDQKGRKWIKRRINITRKAV